MGQRQNGFVVVIKKLTRKGRHKVVVVAVDRTSKCQPVNKKGARAKKDAGEIYYQ